MTRAEGVGRPEVAASLRWASVATAGTRLLAMVRGVVLARLLGPETFGLFLAVSSVTNFVLVGAEMGMPAYVVHRARDVGPAMPSLARGTAVTGLLAGGAVALSAPLFGPLFGNRAVGVAQAMAMVIAITPVANLSIGFLRSQLRMREVAIAQVGAEAIATLVAFAMVTRYRGPQVLVATAIAAPAAAAIVAAGFGRLRFRGGAAGEWRHGARYGVYLTLGALLWTVAMQGDNLLVGSSLGTMQLGLYGLAYSYGLLPAALLGSAVGQVAFTVFALEEDAPAAGAAFVDFSRLLAAVLAPVVTIAVLMAGVAVPTLLGEEWRGAVGPFRVMLVVGAVRACFPTDELLRALGRVRVELWIGMVAAPAVVAAAWLGARQGIELVAILVGSVFVLASIAGVIVACRAASVTASGVLMTTATTAGAVATVGAFGWLGGRALGWSEEVTAFASSGAVLTAFFAGLLSGWLPGAELVKSLLSRRPITT